MPQQTKNEIFVQLKSFGTNLDDLFSDVRIVSGLAKPLACLRGPELEIWHIDVNETIK